MNLENAFSESDRRASGTSQSCRKRKFSSTLSMGSDLDSNSGGEADENFGEAQAYGSKLESIRIGDEQAVAKFYLERFEWIQQLMCRPIALSWVRYIEPGKLSRYPYNGHKRRGHKRRGGDKPSTDQAEQDQEQAEDSSGQETGEPDEQTTKPPWWPPQDCHYLSPVHQKKPCTWWAHFRQVYLPANEVSSTATPARSYLAQRA